MEQKTQNVLEFHKILSLLENLCVCKKTKERAQNLEPMTVREDILAALFETDEAFRFLVKKGAPPISPVADVTPMAKRAARGAVLSMGELLAVGHVLRVSRSLWSYLDEKDAQSLFPLLNMQRESILPQKALEQDICAAILSEEEMADDASSALSAIRKKILSLHNKIRDVLGDMVRSQKYQKCLQEPIVTLRGDRYVVPVKAEFKNEVKGIVHDASASGQTLFVEPMASVEINNELRELFSKEKEEIARILAEFSERVAAVCGEICQSFAAVCALDFFFAKAKLAMDMNAVMPEMTANGVTDIKKGRHPLLDRKKVVPIDISLGADFDTLVITGPNTGGKTVALKTIGLFTLMAQAGLFIPAGSQSKIAVFEHVFADIGDEQSIEQSLSTFSAHMVNIVSILKRVNDKSLVLFDELGAGTDPVEGAALAVSILEFVKACGAKTVATTHYSEIKMYALTTERVENAACEFDIASLAPTYRLLIGVPGKSNAFAISQRLGLDDFIINRAREVIDTENVKFEDILSDLEENRRQAAEAAEAARKSRQEAELARREMEDARKKFRDQKQKIMDEAFREAKKVVEGAKRETEAIVKQAAEAAKLAAEADRQKAFEETRLSLNQKKNAFEDKISGGLPKVEKPFAPPKSVKLGDTVEVTTLGQNGTVATLPDKSGNLMVQVGILKVKTNLKALRMVKENTGEAVAKKFNATRTLKRAGGPAKTEIDVRGETLEEAVADVEKFIDDAALSHLEQVTIIHGKGTGVLRAGISQMLKTNKTVKSYRLGTYGEGESGVTIVELK